MLSPAGLPLKRRYVCSKENRDVAREEIVRGFELDDGKHVVLTDEELEAIAPRKSRDIDLRRFVDAGELDPFLFERTYVLTPAGQTEKPYRLLADVMEREHKAGVATFVMRDKEYLVAIFAERGILHAETLRFAGELRTPKDVGLPSPAKSSAKSPATKTAASFERVVRKLAKSDLARAEVSDERLERLRGLIERKRKRGDDVVEAPVMAPDTDEAADEDEVAGVDLIEAIRRSMRGEADVATRAASARTEGRPSRRAAAPRAASHARASKQPSTGRRKAATRKAASAKSGASRARGEAAKPRTRSRGK